MFKLSKIYAPSDNSKIVGLNANVSKVVKDYGNNEKRSGVLIHEAITNTFVNNLNNIVVSVDRISSMDDDYFYLVIDALNSMLAHDIKNIFMYVITDDETLFRNKLIKWCKELSQYHDFEITYIIIDNKV